MTSNRISLTALVAVALAACGGGGQGESSGDPLGGIPGSQQPSYNDEAPPPNPNAPGNSYDPPPATSGSPVSNPGGPVGGGGGVPASAACVRLCNGLSAKQCDVGSPAECASECATALSEGEVAGCVTELVAVYDCLLASPTFVCSSDGESPGEPDLDAEDLAGCETALFDYVDCAGVGQPGPDEPDRPDRPNEPGPGGGECTIDDDCVGCRDTCDACLCVLEDASLCQNACE